MTPNTLHVGGNLRFLQNSHGARVDPVQLQTRLRLLPVIGLLLPALRLALRQPFGPICTSPPPPNPLTTAPINQSIPATVPALSAPVTMSCSP